MNHQAARNKDALRIAGSKEHQNAVKHIPRATDQRTKTMAMEAHEKQEKHGKSA